MLYIGSRANYSSAKSLLKAFKNHKKLDPIVILGAAALVDKYGNLEELIKSDGFNIDHKISFLVEGGKLENMAQSCGIAMNNFPSIIEKYNPDYIFVIGDRFDVLPIASTAMLMNIPLAHLWVVKDQEQLMSLSGMLSQRWQTFILLQIKMQWIG